MSTALMPPDALLWIDEIEGRYPVSVGRVFHKLFARACRMRTNLIEISVAQLATEIKAHPDCIRGAARALRTHGLDISITPKGARVRFPAEWCPQPFGRDERTLMLPLQAVENPDPTSWPPGPTSWPPGPQEQNFDHNPGYQEVEAPGSQDQKAKIQRNGPGNLLATRRDLLATRRMSFKDLLSTTTKWEQNQQVTSLVVAEQSPGSWPPGPPSSNSNRIVDSSSIEDVSVLVRIERARVVEIQQRPDAEKLASALHAYMNEFGDPAQRDERSLDALIADEELLARILAVAPLGELIQHLTLSRKADVRGMQTYGWFLTRFADKLAGIHKKTLNAALSRAKRSQRQTPKTNPSYETAAAKPATAETQRRERNSEFGPQLVEQLTAGGRKLS